MLLNCTSCQKKFIVPDSAVTKSGRLVQCGSCGNRWTQYPVENTNLIKKKTIKKINKVKNNTSKKNLYSPEYLKKKYGLEINKPNYSSNKKLPVGKKSENSFGFYGYVIVLFIFFAAVFGVLNLTKDLIILKFPVSENYIYYFFEVIEIIKISLTEFINQFNN